jgi:tRNA (Thr-GGU) A37 N-methylase
VLEITGLDAVDGSPVFDIKPYVKGFYPLEDVLTPEWMQQIKKEVDEGNL